MATSTAAGLAESRHPTGLVAHATRAYTRGLANAAPDASSPARTPGHAPTMRQAAQPRRRPAHEHLATDRRAAQGAPCRARRARPDPPDQRHDPVADPGDLPDHQGQLRPRLHADRDHHAHVPGRRLAAPARRRHVHRPQPPALFDRRRHGLHPRRAGQPRLRPELRDHPRLRRLHRHRLVHLPSRSDPHGALRLRRKAGAGPGHLPGRRAVRRRPRAASRRLHHRADGAGEPQLVRLGRDPRHGADGLDGAAARDDQPALPRRRGLDRRRGPGDAPRTRARWWRAASSSSPS